MLFRSTNAKNIEEAAAVQANDVFYLNRDTFAKWSYKCIEILKELVISFTTVGDVVWRDKAVQLMIQNGTTPAEYIRLIKSELLINLERYNI